MDSPRQLLTLEDAAEFLGVSKTSLRRWTNDGRLACHRVGVRRERRFAMADLEAFLASGSGDATPEAAEAGPAATEELAEPVEHPHYCTHFKTKAEQWRMVGPFVRRFLTEGNPVNYLHDPERGLTADEIKTALKADGVDVEAALASGLFSLVPVKQSYLRTGAFSAPRMIDFMESVILKRRADGYEKVLLTGEMSWFLTGAPGVGEMLEYEDRLNGLQAKYPSVTMVCQYDSNQFDAGTVLGALCTHPSVMLSDWVLPGYLGRGASTR